MQASAADAGRATTAEALAEAKRSGKPVEVGSLRAESSDVYAQPDGSLESREYLRPVRARVNGEWRPIDTDLAEGADGTVAPKATTVGIRFSGGGSGPLVRMEKAGREVALSWPGVLPVPELTDATATYRDVLPGVDLRMGAQEDGFTQLLVVKSAEAAASEKLAALRLDLAAEGVAVKETAEGGLEAVDHGAKGAVFEAPKPMMWDSSTPSGAETAASARMRTADAAGAAGAGGAGDKEPAAGESGKLAPVGVELPTSGDALVLKPDADVLAGDDTVYPVFIDPMWYTPRASAWTMASKYWASSPQWKFNGDSDAGMGYCNWSYCQPNDTKRLFYRIPTSKYAGKTILSAEFTVPNTWSASCDARSVELWRTKDISSSTTWNAQNASGFWTKRLASKSFAHGFNGCAAKDAEFDIKSAVQEAANGKASTMTFGLRAAGESDAYAWKRFSNKASLRVRYNQPPPQIKMSQLSMRYGGTCEKQSGDNLSVSPPSSIPPDKRVPSAGAPTTGSGSVSRHLPGQIGDTCLQDRVIADDEGQQQVEQRAVKGRWNFESASGTTPVTTPDLSDQQNPMTLSGGARLGAGWIDASGLELDGVNGSAGTSVMPIDTSAGFTVTAWARGAATPDHPVAVVSGEGTSESAFNVRFVPDPDDPDGLGRWQLTLPDSDGEGAAVRHVSNTEFYDVRDWNHLAVVYDGVAKQARLYVNGILQEFVCGDDDTDGTACEDLISWADNVQTFRADKSLQVGRAKTAGTWGEYFAGSIDDVWAFQGALSSGQVQKLAGSWFGLPTEVPEGD